MANPIRQAFVAKPEAARVVLVDTNGDPYNASGGGAGSDVNIAEVGGNPVGTTVPVSGTVSVTEPVSVDDNGGSITVDAVDLDIRNLVFATDKVDATGSVVDATGSVVLVGNASGASAVNIQDGGNSITIDGSITVLNGAGAAAVNIQDGGNSITVDGPLTDAQLRATPVPVSGTVSVNEPVSVDDNGGSLTVDAVDLDIRNLVFATDKIDASGTILGANSGVDIGDVTINNAGGAAAVNIQDGGNSITIDGTVTANAGTGTFTVGGVAAHDSAVSGNPVLCAGSSETMADSAPANRTTADGEVMRLSATDGALFVIPTGPQTWSYHENSSSQLTDTTVKAAPGTGLSLYVTDIVVSTGAATAFNIFFEESNTTVLGPWYLEAVNGRGLVIHFGTPKKITANTALTVTTSAAIAHSIDITGFIAPG